MLLIIGNTLIVAGGATAHVLQQIVLIYRNYSQKLETDKNYFGHFTSPSSYINFLSYVLSLIIIKAVSNFKNKAYNFTNTYNPSSKLSRNFVLQKLLKFYSQTKFAFWFLKPSRFCIQFLSYITLYNSLANIKLIDCDLLNPIAKTTNNCKSAKVSYIKFDLDEPINSSLKTWKLYRYKKNGVISSFELLYSFC